MRAKNVCVDLCFRFLMMLVVIPALLCMQQCYCVTLAMIPCYIALFFWIMDNASFIKSFVWNLFFIPCSCCAVFALGVMIFSGTINPWFCVCMLAIITMASFLLYPPLSQLKNFSLACLLLTFGGAVFFNTPVFTKIRVMEGIVEFALLLLCTIATSIATWNTNFKQWMRDSCFVVCDIYLCVLILIYFHEMPQIRAFIKQLMSLV